jgi:hypothetical protein
MHAPPQAGKIRRAKALLILIYIVLVVGEVFLTDWEELFGREQCDAISLTTRMWYQRLVTSGYRKPRPHVTRLVTVSSPPGHDFAPCERRLYLAQLISKLRDHEPAIIVLDYSFRPRNDCTQGETVRLQQTIDAVGEKTRIVFGLYSWTEQELRDSGQTMLLEKMHSHGFSERDQLLAQSDITPHGPLVHLGLDRLDCDTRKIPVLWAGCLFSDSGANNMTVPTISLSAARVYDRNVDTQLGNTYRKRQNPFTSFVSEDNFRPIKAEDILGGSVLPIDSGLASKIVVVGEQNIDIHDSVIGHVPGFVLQANYIESLIDDRYFFSLGRITAPLATFALLCLVTVIFDKSPELKIAATRAAILWLVLILVSYIAFVHFAVLITSWIPVFLAILTNIIIKARE